MKKMLRVQLLYFVHRNSLMLFLIMFCSSFQLLSAQSDSLLFRDDFDRVLLGDNWKADNTWYVLGGSAYNPFDAGSMITSENFSSDSYIIETAAMGFSGSYYRQFRIIFGQTGIGSQQTYVLSYSPDTGGQFTLGMSTDNIYYPAVLDEISLYPALQQSELYKFKIARYKSGLIQVYLDNGSGYGTLPVLEAIDSTYQNLGYFGWSVTTQTAAEEFFVDWVEARVPKIEKPAIPEIPQEDDLITQVATADGKPYTVSKLTIGSNIYADRNYQVTSVPSYLEGASFVQTAMEDSSQTQAPWLTTFMKKAVIVYVAYDPRATVLPTWLQGWYKTGDTIGTTDPGPGYLEIYSKTADYWQVYPRPFTLGANLAAPAEGAQANYIVIALPNPSSQRLEAEDATIAGAKIARNHIGYSGSGFVDYINLNGDYVEWTTQTEVPGSYSLGFQFSNGSLYSRSLSLTVDDLLIENATFIPIWGWNSWAFYSGSNVFLKPGTHTIRLTANGASGPNIDYLSFSFSSDFPETNPDSSARKMSPVYEIASQKNDPHPMAYPNPFERSTTISYDLPETSMVNLTVYSLQGRKQAVLLNQIQMAGKHEVEFNASNLTTGSYIYQLRQGNTISIGKVVKR